MLRLFPGFRLAPFVIAALLSIVALSGPGFSQATPDGGFDPADLDEITDSIKQVPLTEDMINRLIASYPDMRAASAKFDATQLPENLPSAGDSNTDLDAMPKEKREALEAVAVKHGFKDLNEWSSVATSVTMSYAYAMQGKKPGSLEEAVKKNIEHAERDPSMTIEQKQKIIEQYREIGAKLAPLEPLKQNYDLVVKMSDKVTPILEAR
jgi:hypothetical protein